MRLPALLLALVAACPATFAAPSAEDLAKMIDKVAAETKVIASRDYSGPVYAFKVDGDPDTLELVFLDHADPQANTVSNDGQAVFLYQASTELQGRLISRAFEIRAQRRLAAAR